MPQIIFYVFLSIKRNQRKKILGNILENTLLSFMIFITISGLWYIPMSRTYINNINSRLQNEKGELYSLDVFSFENLKIYPDWLINREIGLVFFFLFLLALTWKIFNKIMIKEYTLYSAILIPFVLFVFIIKVKHPSFIVPTLFVIAILISDFVTNVKLNKKTKTVLTTFIVIYTIYNAGIPFYNHSPILFYGLNEDKPVVEKISTISVLGQLQFQKDDMYEDVLLYIRTENISNANLVVMSEWTDVYFFTIEYYNMIYNMNLPYHYFYYRNNKLLNMSGFTFDSPDNIIDFVLTQNPKYVLLVLNDKLNGSTETPEYHMLRSKNFNDNYSKIREFTFEESDYPKQEVIFYKYEN